MLRSCFSVLWASNLDSLCLIALIPDTLMVSDLNSYVLQISGTALVLDEIINHVQSLQSQVEVRYTHLHNRSLCIPLISLIMLWGARNLVENFVMRCVIRFCWQRYDLQVSAVGWLLLPLLPKIVIFKYFGIRLIKILIWFYHFSLPKVSKNIENEMVLKTIFLAFAVLLVSFHCSGLVSVVPD